MSEENQVKVEMVNRNAETNDESQDQNEDSHSHAEMSEISSFTDLPAPDLSEFESAMDNRLKVIRDSTVCKKFSNTGISISQLILAIGISAYFIWCLTAIVTDKFTDEREADKTKMLLVGSVVLGILICCLYLKRLVLKTQAAKNFTSKLKQNCSHRQKLFTTVTAAVALLVILIWAVINSIKGSNSIGILGIFVMLIIAFLMSNNKRMVNFQPVITGIFLQFAFTAFILRTQLGFRVFKFISDIVTEFLQFSERGSIFLFGEGYKEHFFAFAVFPAVIYFSSVITILFHFGVMQWLINALGTVMQFFMGTTAAETTVAVGNIFIGMCEAPLLVRPYLTKLTPSEIHCVMTSGLSTIAGSMFAAFVQFGMAPRHLLAACVMSVPASLTISKLMYPETKVSKTTAKEVKKLEVPKYDNVVEAAACGAVGAMPIVVGIAANLVAMISILAFGNSCLTWCGRRAGLDYDVTFELLASYFLWPVAWLMGVPSEDCSGMAQLLGVKTFVNEFVAYEHLSRMQQNLKTLKSLVNTTAHMAQLTNSFVWSGSDVFVTAANVTLNGGIMLNSRSYSIATYALCGFGNFASIAILVGSLTALVPQRRSLFVKCGISSLIASSLVKVVTAAIAGLFITDSDIPV